MMMDRIIGRSISANIRYGGAEKDRQGSVVVDTIAEDLRRKLDGRVYVRPGTVLETESGALAATNGVHSIVHVAAVDGAGPGKGVRADAATVSYCLDEVLEHVNNRRGGFFSRLLSHPAKSILVPLLGTGEGGLTAEQVAPELVDAAIEFFTRHPQTALQEIYLLAYTKLDKDACMTALMKRTELERTELEKA